MGKAILIGGGGGGVTTDDMTNPATANDVLAGQTFATKESDDLVVGAVPNASTSHELTLNEKWTIPAGYHDGTGEVTQNLTYVGAQTATFTTNGSKNITPGYHNGSGKISVTNTKYDGGAKYPGTSNTTISTKSKVLKNKLYIPAQPNLTAANIVRGKTIFGTAGAFDTSATMARDVQLYNGSTFMNWLNGGVITSAHPTQMTSSYMYGAFHSSGGMNAEIVSGKLYTTDIPIYSSGPGPLPARFVSAKTMNFSYYNTLRVTGKWSCTVKVIRTLAWARAGIKVTAITKSGTTITSHGEGGAQAGNEWSGYGGEEGTITYNPSSSFDVRIDISSISHTNAFLMFDASLTRDANSSSLAHWSNEYFEITGMWFLV